MGVLHADDGTALAGVTNPETNAGDARLDEGVGCALISSGPDDEGTAEDRTRLRAWRGRPPRHVTQNPTPLEVESMKPRTPVAALAALACATVGLLAPSAPARADESKSFEEAFVERVHEFELENGLKLLVLPRGDVPVFSAVTMVNVGSVDEHVGITGVAHLFEHMAFKGAREIGTKNYEAEQEVFVRMDAAFRLARAHLDAGRSDLALVAVARGTGVSARPSLARARLLALRGEILELRGDPEGAAESYRQAIRAQGSDVPVSAPP